MRHQDISDELIERFLDRLMRIKGDDHGTYIQYSMCLKQYDQWLHEQNLSAKEVEPLDIEDFILSLKNDNYSANTIRTRYTAVQSLYSSAKDKFQVIDHHPCDGITLSDLNISSKRDDDTLHYVTEDEKDKMIDALPERHFVSNKLIIEILWQTGMRVSELIDIEVDNVDQRNNRIKIYRKKTSEWDYVHYQNSLNRLLDIWLETERPLRANSEYLFPGQSSDQIGYSVVRSVILDAAQEFNEVAQETQDGNKRMRIRPHSFRHGHAVHALKSGVNVRAVQEQLGHASLERTMQYMRLVEDDVAEAYKKFS
ncbi:tyrosine-type recombinase/integrase [Halalkalicoccus jeotgali]|uniref:Integrase/recombinase n=1 Tax=Halalkalicoccus jeotgali (strain DSM 18796 / CECT 7217 / JCM 14584 / KCTC 4019 / B3) TaxID=795797 RepID=D8JAX0_HALJB|nr:tyrosine-type recombinase/integrase [Halalkalicoccus jeotgali]ADJ14842.1 integrase/recombinase [Halalkalicoccus jeotgali B3]ELY39425.1 integrase/recombinase [Halalkalicoccus jeotgali B3]